MIESKEAVVTAMYKAADYMESVECSNCGLYQEFSEVGYMLDFDYCPDYDSTWMSLHIDDWRKLAENARDTCNEGFAGWFDHAADALYAYQRLCQACGV